MEGRAGPEHGRRRVVIEGLAPDVDGGRFPIKRVVGEPVVVEADVFADGHDLVRAELLERADGERDWRAHPMRALGNDRWRAAFEARGPGRHRFLVRGRVDDFETWRRGLERKVAADQDVSVDLRIGAAIVRRHATAAPPHLAQALVRFARVLERDATLDPADLAQDRVLVATSPELRELVEGAPDLRFATTTAEREVVVDPRLAEFSAWYELFPRSWGEGGRHGTLRDVEERALPYVASLGFDVLYLPPIHPVGRTARKGPNNRAVAAPGDVGSPWAIGGPEGGHTAVDPRLGTVEDVRRLARRCRERGIELALDLAFQCSPDHPWVREHPEWFRRRPDGTVQSAENPPKKYQDIYPLDFESDDWRGLWDGLRDVVLFWVGHGVRVFRVDNPHTKALPFWEWCIAEVKARHPEVLFLSEAFTRPKVMYRLAKLGFSQSYTYFTWRNTAHELSEYLGQLRQVRDFFRPNLWPNTPDILPEYLQAGGRPAFIARLVLAATLGASYGVYGPAFELCEARPREPGSEEYLDSEKYQLRRWDLDAPHSLRDVIARVNRVRREHLALQSDRGLELHATDNEQLLCFSKRAAGEGNVVVVVVNLDPHHRQSGWTTVPLARLGVEGGSCQVHDLLGGGRFLWSGSRHFVQLDPHELPAHVFAVRRRVRSEQDFDYFM